MGLTPHGPRELSNLERAAVDLVFWAYIGSDKEIEQMFDDLRISHVRDLGPGIRGLYGNNHISISIRQHSCTDNLNYNSALGNTDIFKPGNMCYLNTFIHECTHHWQIRKNRFPQRFGEYDFTKNQLMFWDLDKEGHASAAATWFIMEWQLKYAYGDEVNLTTKPPGHSVGTVDRYGEIKKIPHGERGRWVPMLTASDGSMVSLMPK